MVWVSWEDAKAFCEWLGKKEALQYRLPTDEEWDAAVGKGKYPWGDSFPPPKDAGNFSGEEARLGDVNDPNRFLSGWKDVHPRTAPVGSYKKNELGLHDLSGNVWEWCEDWYTEEILRKVEAAGAGIPPDNVLPGIMKGCVYKVERGGSWASTTQAIFLFSARRGYREASGKDGNSGFRCVLVIDPSR